MTITMNENTKQNGIELSFDTRPDRAVCNDLKAHGFRWSPTNQVWWHKADDDSKAYAEKLCAPVSIVNVEVDDDEIVEVQREFYTLDELTVMLRPTEVVGNKKRKKIKDFSVSVTEDGIVLEIA